MVRRDYYGSQNKYIDKMLEKFKMYQIKHVSTPIGALFQISNGVFFYGGRGVYGKSAICKCSRVTHVAMVCTRLDLSHAVSLVSRYMSNLGKRPWEAIKWVR